MTKRELWDKCAEIEGLQEFIKNLKDNGIDLDWPYVIFEPKEHEQNS